VEALEESGVQVIVRELVVLVKGDGWQWLGWFGNIDIMFVVNETLCRKLNKLGEVLTGTSGTCSDVGVEFLKLSTELRLRLERIRVAVSVTCITKKANLSEGIWWN
jgi:hypothetical protein